jgi:enoyl-CoA hydratase/carnithine racemase
VRASGREWSDNATYHGGFFDKAMALCESMPKPVIAAISGTALTGMRSYEAKKIISPARGFEV